MAAVACASSDFSGNALINQKILEIKNLEKKRDDLRNGIDVTPLLWGGGVVAAGAGIMGVMTGGLGVAIAVPAWYAMAQIATGGVQMAATSATTNKAKLADLDNQISLKYSSLIKVLNKQYSQGNLRDIEALSYYSSLNFEDFSHQFGNDLEELKNNLGV